MIPVVIITNSQSYRDRTPLTVLSSAKAEKKRKYLQACKDQRATFTPLCMSIDGMMGCGATVFLRWLTDLLFAKWVKDYDSVMGWVCTFFHFSREMTL